MSRQLKARTPRTIFFKKTLPAMLLVASLALLVGCQGVSAGPHSVQGGNLSLANGSLNFGDVVSGDTKTLTVSATNTGDSSLTITGAAISTKYFSLASPSLPITIAAGQSAALSFKFSPNAKGSFSAQATINSDASDGPSTLSLSGAGVVDGQLALSPTGRAFGSVVVGGKPAQTVTLTNNGGTSVNISHASISGTGFQLSGISVPITLNAAQSTTFIVTFVPQTTGSMTGTVTITSDASNPTLTMALSGTGVAAGALGSNPTSVSFGSVTVGGRQTQQETVTNTGGTSVTISQVGASGAGYSVSGISTPVTLGAGQSASFTVAFSPQSAGNATGNVTVTSNATNPTLTIPLSGTGLAAGALGSNPTSLSFGSVTVGGQQTKQETVTNTGGTSVTISQVGASGAGYSVSGISTPVTLGAGQSASFTVAFSPQSAGNATGNVTVTSNATNPTLTIPLSGTGLATTGQLSASPGTLGLGSAVVGSSKTSSGSLTATGASVTVAAASTNDSEFSVSGLTLPVTIPAGQSVSYSVTFSPQVAGAANATLTFTSNAQPATTTQSLTGTGTAAPTHSVDLSWNASNSSNINGYNVYRAPYQSSCGSFVKINSLLNTGTLYTDFNVASGTSYCYATTAVNSSSQESGYSNVVSNVQIPTP